VADPRVTAHVLDAALRKLRWNADPRHDEKAELTDAQWAALAADLADRQQLRDALSWALDVLETSLARIDTVDGPPSDYHVRLRTAGLAKARAALASAETEKEPT